MIVVLSIVDSGIFDDTFLCFVFAEGDKDGNVCFENCGFRGYFDDFDVVTVRLSAPCHVSSQSCGVQFAIVQVGAVNKLSVDGTTRGIFCPGSVTIRIARAVIEDRIARGIVCPGSVTKGLRAE